MTFDDAIAVLLGLDGTEPPTQSAIDRARALLPPGADVLCSTRGDGGLRVHIRGTGWDHLRLLVSPDPADCPLLYRRTGPLAYCEPATAGVVRNRRLQ